MSKSVKMAVIGCGKWGLERALSFQEQGVEIVAVCDIDDDTAIEAGNRLGLEVSAMYSGEQCWRQLIYSFQHEYTGIAVLTSPWSRGEMLPELVHTGKSLYLEKPLCATKEQLFNALNAYRAASPAYDSNGGPITATGHAGRSPLYRFLRDTIKSGVWGELRGLHLSHGWRWNYINKDNWRGDPSQGGGHILEKLVHQLDGLLWAVGTFGWVQATGIRLPRNPEVWNQLTAVLEPCGVTEISVPVTISASFGLRHQNMQSMEAVFEEKRILVYEAGGRFWSVDEGGKQTEIGGDDYWWPIHNMRRFTDAVKCEEHEELVERSTFMDGFYAMELALGVRRALETGQRQELLAAIGT